MQGSGLGYVKCENLSPMQMLQSDQDGGQHHRIDDPSKVGSSDSCEGKDPTIDDDIIHEVGDSNMLDQSQVIYLPSFCFIALLFVILFVCCCFVL